MTKRYYSYEETHRTVSSRKQKLCTKCKKWKGESEFGKDRAKRDGLKIQCKDCDRAYTRALYRKYRKGKKVRVYLRFEERHRTVRGVKQKLCCSCNKWKDESHYYRHRRLKDGLSLRCKDCGRRHTRKRLKQKNKGAKRYLRYEDRHRVVKGAKEKLCSKCGTWKKESEYYKYRSSKDGLMGPCRKCSYKATSKSYKPKRKGVRRNIRYEDRHRVVKGTKEKLCVTCQRWKKESDFYKHRSKKDGLTVRCKKCSYKPAHNTRKKRRPRL